MIDASAVIELLLHGSRAGWVADSIAGRRVHSPDLIVPEVLSALRRLERNQRLDRSRADHAVTDFDTMPLSCWPTYPLLLDIWRLRGNLTAYDATYAALARRLACALVSTDARLGRAPGLGVQVLTP